MFNFQSIDQQPFPIDTQLPNFRNLIRYSSKEIGRSDGLVVGTVLALVGLIFAPRVALQTFWGKKTAPCLYFQTIAPSSFRKSAIATALQKVVAERVHQIKVDTVNYNNDFKVRHESWKLQKRIAEKNYKIACKTEENEEEALAYYESLLAQEPCARPHRAIIHSDFTHAAFLADLDKNDGVGGIIIDEGTGFYNNLLMAMVGHLNSGWSNIQLRKETIKDGIFANNNPRISMHISIQDDVFFGISPNIRKALHDNGFFGRLNLAAPLLFPEDNASIDFKPNQKEFESIIQYFSREMAAGYPLDGPYAGEGVELVASDEVELKIRELAEAIDIGLRPGGVYVEIAHIVGKMPEKIYRMMGILHQIEGRDNCVLNIDIYYAALAVMKWFGHEHWRLLVMESRPTRYDVGVTRITKYLEKRNERSYNPWISHSQLRQNVSCISDDAAFSDEVLTLMINRQIIFKRVVPRNVGPGQYFYKGGKKRVEYALCVDVRTGRKWDMYASTT